MLDNSRHLSRARTVASATIGLCLIYAVPEYGWWMLPMFALSVLNNVTLDTRMRRSRKPEYHVAVSLVGSQMLLALAAALTGGPSSLLLPLVAVPTAFFAARFRAQVAWLGMGVGILALFGATFGAHAAQTVDHPAGLLVALAIVVGVTAVTQALNGAEVHHRKTAILDPLTGLLNRQGLERRFDELAEQARLNGAPISLLVCDLDHFKAVNDMHGHAMGDAVLRDVAYELRKQLRSFELIYRIGGEEFLIVLPGATPEDAAELGERVCEATRRCRSQGLSLTLSVGVSTLWGNDADFKRLFDAADRALYQAKTDGRDRIRVAPSVPPVAAVPGWHAAATAC